MSRMKYNPKLVEDMGTFIAAGIADIVALNKMPQLMLKLDGGWVDKVRIVMLNNLPIQMNKEEIAKRIYELKAAPGKDIGFSYTANGVRVIIVPEEMTITPVLGAPLGTPSG